MEDKRINNLIDERRKSHNYHKRMAILHLSKGNMALANYHIEIDDLEYKKRRLATTTEKRKIYKENKFNDKIINEVKSKLKMSDDFSIGSNSRAYASTDKYRNYKRK